MMFARSIVEKLSNPNILYFSPNPTSAYALPLIAIYQKLEIASIHKTARLSLPQNKIK